MKLEYKCQKNKINLVKIHEGYTSVLCSNCGNEHKALGSNKTYDCIKCKIQLDRDINASRNIYIKSYSSIISIKKHIHKKL